MSDPCQQDVLARPCPPDNEVKAGPNIDQNWLSEMSIESMIRCKEKRTHPTPLPGEHLCEISSKRCACSISTSVDGLGFSTFFEEAPSKRGGTSA
jgi:hypothetical protein